MILKYFKIICLILLVLGGFSFIYFHFRGEKKPMVVVIPSYNNIRYFQENLDSVLSQSNANYRIIYIDDASNDGMCELLDLYLREKKVDFISHSFKSDIAETIPEVTEKFKNLVNAEKHFFTLVRNVKRTGALANIYRAVLSLDDSEIVVLVDGDDRLADSKVLSRVNAAYSAKNEIWMTHGTLMEHPSGYANWCEPIPEEIINKNAFREFKCPSHLRTFYAALFKKIDLQDLLYKGDFFQMTWDMAIMYPMCEMSGKKHGFLKKINYLYNMANNINDNKVDPKLQNDLDDLIRNMPRYQPLEQLDVLIKSKRDR